MPKMGESKQQLKELYKNLQSDLNSDKIYWTRNDAKLRAVLVSKSYEEFRDIVDAAHLKCLSREDGQKKASTSWNRAV